MTQVFVGLGSNVDPRRNVSAAVAALRQVFENPTVSPAYLNPAVGFEGDDFINAVVGFSTERHLRDVLRLLKQIELRLGKDLSAPRFAAKVIDLDLLYFGDHVIRNDRITIPRKDVCANVFYLKPLAELAPDWLDPLSGKSMESIWAHFGDEHGAEGRTEVRMEPVTLADLSASHGAVLTIDDLRVAVHLGVPEAERSKPQDILLSLRIECDIPPQACTSDCITESIDYGVLSRKLIALIQAREFKTIEHLGHCCLLAASEGISGACVMVKVRKHPQIEGLEGGASFELTATIP